MAKHTASSSDPRRPARRRKPSAAKRFFAFAMLLLLGLFGGTFVAKRMSDPHATIASTLTSMINPVPPPQRLFQKDRLSILLLGIDYSYDDKDQEYSAGARSDTIMAMSLDLPTHSLHILSVPRDMEYTYPSGNTDKINSAYSLGGPHESEKVIADFLGLPGFDRYLVLRINATKDLVDAIGGIDVPVTETLNYDDSWGHLHIHFKPGLTHMNGEQAVSYSRFRHDACSDPCRIKRQQQVLRLTIAKLKADKFNDFTHIQSLIDVVNKNVETDLSPMERLSLAEAYSGFDVATLKSDQVPFTDDRDLPNAGNVLVPDNVAKAKLVQQLFLAEVPSTATPDPQAVAAIDPTLVHVSVQNGSGTSGVGRNAADALRKRGFVIDSVGNAETFDHEITEIRVSSSVPYIGERVRTELGLPSATIVDAVAATAKTDAASSDVTIVVGRDFLAKVDSSAKIPAGT